MKATTKKDAATDNKIKALPSLPLKGTRQIGSRKRKLLLSLQKTLQNLQKKGINASYALHKMTEYKGPVKTRTKHLSGIISELKQIK